MDFPQVNKIDWYPSAWLAGTRGMSPQAKGLYIDLICWQLAGHPIPGDTRMVSAITGVELEVVDECWPELKTKMTVTDDVFYNLRAYTEAVKRSEFCESRRKSSMSGHKSNGKPKAKTKTTARRKAKFVKPSAEQVQAYCDERNNGISGQDFIDHYDRNGWVTGKTLQPMRDWKACVRTWENKRKNGNATGRAQRNDDAVKGFQTLPLFSKWDGKLEGDT